jgi:hypothetical protein
MLLHPMAANSNCFRPCRRSGTPARVRGLRARGGFTVDLSWRGGRLERAGVRASVPARPQVRYGDEMITISLGASEAIGVVPG